MTTHTVVGNGNAGDNMYQALALPWVTSLLGDQRLGGIIALIITEVTLLLAVVVLLLRWQAAERAADEADQQEMLNQFRHHVTIR
jgi:putative copper resistance protein D